MQRWKYLLGILFAVAALGPGCASAPKRGVSGPDVSIGSSASVSARTNVVYHQPEREIDPFNKFNPVFWFGNIDDPVPPAKYRPDDPCRTPRWHLRNTFHNFTFYVIGIADKEFERTGRYPAHVFNPRGGWNWAVSKYRWWRLPFVSYGKGRFKFYCGWRNHGNFGMKLNLKSSDPLKVRRAQLAGSRTEGSVEALNR